MAPKKAALEKAIAMKAMKIMKVKKHAMKQGILKTSRALGKAKSLEKAKLNKKNLEKLGSQTLDEKIKAAIEAGESEEHSAELLKQSLTKSEHSKVWSKHKIALEKASAAERKKHEQLSKKDKGLAASKWLLEKEGKKYVSALKKVRAEESLTRKEKWETEKQMLQKFSEEELQLHLQSGRVIWQECPTTWGTYEYKDLHDYEKTTTNARGKEWTEGLEFEPGEEDLEKFLELYDSEALSVQVSGPKGSLGKGKGQQASLGKGKGKGKGKRGQPALGNGGKGDGEEDTPEEALEKAMKAARTARNMVTSTKADLEEALEKASKHLTKSGKNAGQLQISNLGKELLQLKNLLAGKSKAKTPESIKAVLAATANVIKSARDEIKELRHLENKAGSASGSRKAGR